MEDAKVDDYTKDIPKGKVVSGSYTKDYIIVYQGKIH